MLVWFYTDRSPFYLPVTAALGYTVWDLTTCSLYLDISVQASKNLMKLIVAFSYQRGWNKRKKKVLRLNMSLYTGYIFNWEILKMLKIAKKQTLVF